MFVKFTTASGNNQQWGMQNAIIATATAVAGSTPATPSGCDDYVVLSNVEAGGWFVDPNDDSLSSITDGSGTTKIYAPTKKSNMDKSIAAKHLWFDWDTSSQNLELVRIGVSYPDSYPTASPLLQSIENTVDDVAVFGYNWYISCTENYFYMWKEERVTSYFGFADLSGTPSVLLAESNNNLPVAGLGTTGGTNTTALHNLYWLRNGTQASYHSTMTIYDNAWNTYLGTDTTNSLNESGPWNHLFTVDSATAGTGRDYCMAYNGDGRLVPTLHPFPYFNPLDNIPYQTIDGIKILGIYKYKSDASAAVQQLEMYQNKVFYDENGDRYMAITPFLAQPLAIRCV